MLAGVAPWRAKSSRRRPFSTFDGRLRPGLARRVDTNVETSPSPENQAGVPVLSLVAITTLFLVAAPPAFARTWKSSDGVYSLDAEYVGAKDGKVSLRKPNGDVIEVPLARLSAEDQAYVAKHAEDLILIGPASQKEPVIGGRERPAVRSRSTPAATPAVATSPSPQKQRESGIHKAISDNDFQSAFSITRDNPASLVEMEGSDSGFTPLHTAAEHGNRQMADLLLRLGVDVNIRARNRETPLITAAGEGHTELGLFFIAKGADVKAAADDGTTALHLAAIENLPDLARVLLDKGAVFDARTADGETPLDFAIQHKSKETAAQIIQEHRRQLALKEATAKRCPPFATSTPSIGWQGVTIEKMGTLDIPHTLEVQDRDFIRIVKSMPNAKQFLDALPQEFLSELPDELAVRSDTQIGRTVIQPAGLNAFESRATKLYFRLIIETDKAEVGTVGKLDDRLGFSESELHELAEDFKSGMPPQFKEHVIEFFGQSDQRRFRRCHLFWPQAQGPGWAG